MSGGSAATWVNGPLVRTLPPSIVYRRTYTFPVGKGSFKMLELVNPTTNAGGTVTIEAEAFDTDSGGTAGTGFDALNHNRYWSAQITAGGGELHERDRPPHRAGHGDRERNRSVRYAQTARTTRSAARSRAPRSGPSNVVTTLGYFAVGRVTGASTISGSFNVGTGGDFATLTAAVAALNTRVMIGPVTFQLTDNAYAGETFPIQINPNGGNSATNTLTIKPAPGASPVFSGSSATALISPERNRLRDDRRLQLGWLFT